MCARGLDGFFDGYSIQPGDLIPARIALGLEDCDVYVPILSPASLASPWSDLEINTAITLSRERGRNGRPRIISVIAEPCSVPVLLRAMLYVDFVGRYDEALRALLTVFGVSVASQPQVTIPPTPQIVIPPAPELPRTITGKDGKEMLLIPAGEFVMGSDERKEEQPPHKVYSDAFYISRYPVTNAEYKKFVDATKHRVPDHWKSEQIPHGKENHPVVYVSWQDAADYAQWADVRLPTEAEWEKAASWDDAKKEKRRYPWGNEFHAKKCNASESKIGDTTPVGKYSSQGDSFYGIGDMAGNVWEWCADWYDESYYRNSPERNPQGPDSGQIHVLRGGSWFYDLGYARCAFRFRYFPDYRAKYVGFRVAESFPRS
ncbi:MAG: SUMF1/EgtB/PvdO family nonheme iron enzyme [Chloroflexi bacterium]|nr:SUMF1/EgtB/PvdO family nonheme iron enzyme [Chloroflexota bacterium]